MNETNRNPMPGRDTMDTRLLDLLLFWEEERKQGRTLTPEELCQGCPDLLPNVQHCLGALRSMAHRMGETSPSAVGGTMGADADLPRLYFDGLQPGLELKHGYKLLSRLGRGGFGEVWKAQGPGGIRVALKFVPYAGKPGESETRALNLMARLRHPNVLTISGAWKQMGLLVVAMDLADRTLWDRLQEALRSGLSGIPRDELLDYMEEAAKGLDYLNSPDHKLSGKHGVGVQHRDVKPQNLLLVGGGVKVGDFGLARLLERTATSHTGNLTVAYAAPEFFRGETSRTSDQYSLAVTYCVLRGGRLPFQGHAAQLMAGHLTGVPDLSGIPPLEWRAVHRALSKDPQARWPDCRSFVTALKATVAVPRPSGTEPPPSQVPTAPIPVGLPVVPAGRKPASERSASGEKTARSRSAMDSRATRIISAGLMIVGILFTVGVFILGVHQLSLLQKSTQTRSVVETKGSGPATRRESTEPSPPGNENPADTEPAMVRVGSQAAPVLCLALSSDNSIAVTSGGNPKGPPAQYGDTALRVWDLKERKLLTTFREHRAPALSLVLLRDGNHVISGDISGELIKWNLNGKIVRDFNRQRSISSIALNRDGESIYFTEGTDSLVYWDPKKAHINVEGIYSTGSSVWHITALPRSNQIALGATNGDIYTRLDRDTPWIRLNGHLFTVPTLAITPDRTRIISGAGARWMDSSSRIPDRSVRVWDIETKSMLKEFDKHGDLVTSVASSPDGRRALSASLDGTIRLWSIPGPHTRMDGNIPIDVVCCLRGHVGPVYTVQYLADGKHAISGGQDGTIRLWRLPD